MNKTDTLIAAVIIVVLLSAIIVICIIVTDLLKLLPMPWNQISIGALILIMLVIMIYQGILLSDKLK